MNNKLTFAANGEAPKTIEIPDSVKKIGCSAFRNCSSLTSITLPDSITNMREGVFSNCENLKSILLKNVNKLLMRNKKRIIENED